MRLMTTLCAVAVCVSMCSTAEAEPLKSGPQVGDRLSTFMVVISNGTRVGRRRGTS